ncbi:MAG: hypothetical protein MZV64_09900 [Ignavibacteriales bacterium]|nr:hypothetical protein [Ignavibacteriales bacterium]
MQAYLTAHGLPGVRMLVVHQFTRNDDPRTAPRSGRTSTGSLSCTVTDGFGPPALKRIHLRR